MTTTEIKEVGQWFTRLFRMWPAWIASLLLLGLTYFIAPTQIGVTLAKALSITLGGVIGFWMHVWVYGHIDGLPLKDCNPEKNRRALFVCSGMLAFALAV